MDGELDPGALVNKTIVAGPRLDPSLTPQAWRSAFQAHGRLHVPGFLRQEDASALMQGVASASGWRRSVHVAPGQDHDFLVSEWDAADPKLTGDIQQAVYRSARDEFRYMFDSVRITRERPGGVSIDPGVGAALAEAAAFLNGEAFLQFVRDLTGDDRPAYSDAMATRYLPGHFLTAHDDEKPDAERLYAYVLNLTPRWRADWGGMLLFLDDLDHVEEGYVPSFNALNIFRVPQRHAVSMVTSFAGAPRLSITGWIHARPGNARRN
jgi:Rps23 Pro-64 3,4-dihydroxylase Tpa1-like proline 4-hydroxylase